MSDEVEADGEANPGEFGDAGAGEYAEGAPDEYGDVDPNGGDAAVGEVRLLDLTGRDRQTLGAVQAMERIASHFARSARRSLPFLARYKAHVVASAVETVVSGTPPEPSEGPTFALTVISTDGSARGSVGLNAEAISFVLEGALGGKSAFWEIPLAAELTVAQRAVLSRITGSLVADFAGALKEEIKLAVELAASDLRAATGSKATDMLAVGCHIEGLPVPAKITISVSAPAVESAARATHADGAAQYDPRIAERLKEVPVEVVAELGRVPLGLRRIMSLQVGDIIRLPTATDDPITVRVAGVAKFAAVPVISRGQIAVEIRARHGT